MLVRQAWKRKTSTSKLSPSSQKDSPSLPPRVYLQSPSPPSYNPLRDQMINQLHNISTILDSHTNQSNAYIHALPSPPLQQIYPSSHAQVEFHSSFVIDVINKEREVDPINAQEMISKEFATHAPKMIEELFRKYMQHSTLNLYPATSSSTAGKLTADLQQQLYLKMKSTPQDQAVDLELWEILKAKFEKQ
ncbi:hypothetical protein Tco_1415879 [Tanacetum coccineum]